MYASASLLLLATYLLYVNCCNLHDVTLQAYEDKFLNRPLAIKPINGCIDVTGDKNLDKAAIIIVKNQLIPILEKGSVKNLRGLIGLTLDNNKIKEVRPGAFVGLDSVDYISLNDNRIVEIQEGVFNGSAIIELHLSNNLISEIATGAFDNLPRFTTIDLSNNKLTAWNNNWFTNTPNVYNVFMSKNLIKNLQSAAFWNVLGRCKVIDGVSYHANIFLDENQISYISPTSFMGVCPIGTLDLENNQIRDINGVFTNSVRIGTLNLKKNFLSCVQIGMKTKNVLIEGNPISDECMKSFRKYFDL